MTRKIIFERKIVEDDFAYLSENPEGEKLIVPLVEWQADPDKWLAGGRAVGVRVPSDKLPRDIPRIDELALIAVEFPRFTDGRGYSVGRMLRQRHAFRGQLRAVGWVLRDHLLAMERVGFNAFELQAGKSLESALEAFGELPIAYQATVPDPRPLYRRRGLPA
jgi:uncharacterized protein (DUF934 family)